MGLLRDSLLHIFAPLTCEICPTAVSENVNLCTSCKDELPTLPIDHCSVCARPFESQESSPHRCADCLKNKKYFIKIHTPFLLKGSGEKLLHQAKFGRQVSSLRLIANLSLDYFAKILSQFEPDYLVPVPLSFRRHFFRGLNQSEILTRLINKKLPQAYPVFTSTTRTHHKAQAQQDLKNRLKLTHTFFKIKQPNLLHQKKLLVIDDVITTGTTVNSFCEALHLNGAGNIEVFAPFRASR